MADCILDKHCPDGGICLTSGKCTKQTYGEGSRCSETVLCPDTQVCIEKRCRLRCAATSQECVGKEDGLKYIIKKSSIDAYDCEFYDQYGRNERCMPRALAGKRCPAAMNGSRIACVDGHICFHGECKSLCTASIACEDESLNCLNVINGPFGVCLSDSEAAMYKIDLIGFPKYAIAFIFLLTFFSLSIIAWHLFFYLKKRGVSFRQVAKRSADKVAVFCKDSYGKTKVFFISLHDRMRKNKTVAPEENSAPPPPFEVNDSVDAAIDEKKNQ